MLEGKTLNGRFCLLNRIGEGTFCHVYLATDQNTLKKVAVKVLKDATMSQMFRKEISTMEDLERANGVAKYLASGTMGDSLYIAMELLSTDVLKVFLEHGPLPIPILLRVARESLAALESMHDLGYLHLDIKPDNIALKKKGPSYMCHLVDLGMAMKYMHAGTHHRYTESGEFHGNPIFASVNILQGRRPSRRDDVESLVYTVAFLANSTLPWMKMGRMNFGEMRASIADMKGRLSPAAICKNLPPEFAQILTLARELTFAERPNYSHYQRLLEQAAHHIDSEFDADWPALLSAKESISESTDSIPFVRQSMTEKPKHEMTPDSIKPADSVAFRRSTKKRLTKNAETLGMIPRSNIRHAVVISKTPISIPEEMKELDSPPFPGRREKSRETTLVSTQNVALTSRVRENLQLLRRPLS